MLARTSALIERRTPVVVVALVISFFYLAVHKSHGKPIWYDEIFTAIVAMQPDWHHFVGAMPAEGNPPVSTLLTKLSTEVFGVGGFGLRLPQMLGFTAALAGVYLFVRRECGALYGLLAIALVLAQPVWKYSIEARPYGLLMAFFMLALLGWQAAAHAVDDSYTNSRTLSLMLMTAGIAGCILSHNIGIVMIGSPLLLGEGIRTLQRRSFDWQMLASQALGYSAIFITLPMIHRTHETVLVYASNITLPLNLPKLWHYRTSLFSSLYQVVDVRFTLLLAVAMITCWIICKIIPEPLQSISTFGRVRVYIVGAALGAIALIPITWIAMIPAGGWYFCRYGCGTAFGMALVSCFTLKLQRVSRLVILTFIILAGGNFVDSYLHFSPEYPLDQKTLDTLRGDTSGLPIVITDPFSFPTLWWHSPIDVRNRLYYVVGPNSKDLLQSGLVAEHPYWNFNIENYRSLSNRFDHAHALCPSPQFCPPLLRSIGFDLLPLKEDPLHFFDIRRGNSAASESK